MKHHVAIRSSKGASEADEQNDTKETVKCVGGNVFVCVCVQIWGGGVWVDWFRRRETNNDETPHKIERKMKAASDATNA